MAVVEQRGLTIERDKLGGIAVSKKWVVDTVEETMTVGDEFVLGLPEDDRSAGQREDLRYEVTVNYRGADDDTPQAKERWGGKLSFREDPIQAHPNWPELRDTYGWVPGEDGKGHFPEEMKGTPGTAALSKGNQSLKKNPMFGAKSYPVIVGDITHSYLRKTLPGDLLNRVGKVLESLPGSSGIQTPEGYSWLTQCPEFEQEGNAWRIVDHYKLVPTEGYLAIVYKLIKRR